MNESFFQSENKMNNVGTSNEGRGCIGNYNHGEFNTGERNEGQHNVGVNNQGDFNIGLANQGQNNAGIKNKGNHNVGEGNEGNYNLGYGNRGEGAVGAFCTETKLYMFNKPCDWTVKELLQSPAAARLIKVIQDPSCWCSFTQQEKREISELPNFSNEIFKELTGLDFT